MPLKCLKAVVEKQKEEDRATGVSTKELGTLGPKLRAKSLPMLLILSYNRRSFSSTAGAY
jgi:hypothetical protein